MLPAEQRRGEALLALARTCFDTTLRPIEEQVLLQSCTFEDPSEWTAAASAPEPAGEPDHNAVGRPLPHWNGPELRPALLRWLLTDTEAAALLGFGGLRVWGARFTQPLDLTNCRTSVRVDLRYCLFAAPVLLSDAQTGGFFVRQSTLVQGLRANHIHVQGLLFFDGCVVGGELECSNARVDGRFHLRQTFLVTAGVSHSFQRTAIQDELLLTPGFECAGEMRFSGATIGSSLSLDGAIISATQGVLAFDKARVQGGAYLTKVQSAIDCNLAGAELGGELVCSAASLTGLNLDSILVHSNVHLTNDFRATGMVRLSDAVIDGQLICSSAHLLAPDISLLLDGARIGGHVMLTEGFEAAGMVRLVGARLGGQLNCDLAQFHSTDEALILIHAKIATDVFLTHMTCAGIIRLLGAEIGGDFTCADTLFRSPSYALRLDAAKILGSVSLGATFNGASIGMQHASIAGQLDFQNATALGTVECDGLSLDADLLWFNLRQIEKTRWSLADARIKKIIGQAESWPMPNNLYVNGLEVGEIETLRFYKTPQDQPAVDRQSFNTEGWIAWLNLQNEPSRVLPQPWHTLSGRLKQKGQSDDAKRVLFELRRNQIGLQWKDHPVVRAFAIYRARLEEEPMRILTPILATALLSGSIFHQYRAHFAETSESAYKSTHTVGAEALAYPKFQPFVYALENVLPIVKLGQDEHWAPDPRHSTWRLYWSLMILRWILILAGWVMGGMLAAAVSARFRS